MEHDKCDKELNVDIEKREDNVIYEWLKEHPSAIFSIFSAVVLALSFVFRAMIYKNERKYLEYWHLESRLIEISVSDQIYEIVGLVIFSMAMLVMHYCMISAFEKYYKVTKICACGRILQKNVRKEIKKTAKDLSKLSKRIDMFGDKELLRLEKNKKSLEGLQDRHLSIKNSLKNVNDKLTRIYRKKLIRTLLVIVIGFVMTLVVFCSICVLDASLFEFFVSGIAMVLILIVFDGVLIWIYTRLPQIRKFKKIDYENQDIEYKQYIKEYKEEYANKDQGIKVWKNWFTDKMITQGITGATLFFVACLFILNVVQSENLGEKNNFDVTYVENMAYVILYRDNTYLYMEEAKIDDNSITIYIDKQRRIELENIYSSNCSFENVVRLDNRGNIVE